MDAFVAAANAAPADRRREFFAATFPDGRDIDFLRKLLLPPRTFVLSFKAAGGNYAILLTQLSEFFREKHGTARCFPKNMAEIAGLCSVHRITNPRDFSQAMTGRPQLCAELANRIDEVEWQTADGRAAPLDLLECDWNTVTQKQRCDFIWQRMCAANESDILRKTDFPIYTRAWGKNGWLRYEHGKKSSTCARACEVPEDEAIPDWLTGGALAQARKLHGCVATNTSPGANPDCRQGIYMFVINGDPNVPIGCRPQAYVGESAEGVSFRWFRPRKNSAHIELANSAIRNSRIPNFPTPDGTTILADLTIACCWMCKPDVAWWARNTRLYVLSSSETCTAEINENREADLTALRQAEQNAIIDTLDLTKPSCGLNLKGGAKK